MNEKIPEKHIALKHFKKSLEVVVKKIIEKFNIQVESVKCSDYYKNDDIHAVQFRYGKHEKFFYGINGEEQFEYFIILHDVYTEALVKEIVDFINDVAPKSL